MLTEARHPDVLERIELSVGRRLDPQVLTSTGRRPGKTRVKTNWYAAGFVQLSVAGRLTFRMVLEGRKGAGEAVRALRNLVETAA